MTLAVGAIAFLSAPNAWVGDDDVESLDFIERLAARLRHPGLMDAALTTRRRMEKAAVIARRKSRLDDAIVARMDGDAIAAEAAMKALDADDEALMRIARQEAAAERLRGARK